MSEPAQAPTPTTTTTTTAPPVAVQQQQSAYQPPASQADLDRIVESRLNRERAKYDGLPDDWQDKIAFADAARNELASETEKAVNAARKEERDKVTAAATPRLVHAEFKAAAKGVLSSEQLAALLEDLNLGNYVTAKGDADEEKIARKVSAFAPATGGHTPPPRSLGQGNQPPVTPKPGERGQAQAEKRFGKRP